MGRNSIGKVLAFGGGNFGREESHSFLVPENFVEEEEKPLIGDGQIPLTIVIQLDNFPEEVGWRIDRLGIQIDEIIRIPAGIYTVPEATIIRTIVLEKEELYYFSLYDIIEDGIEAGYGKRKTSLSCVCNGYFSMICFSLVQLFLGTQDTADKSRMIFESDGIFQSAIDHTFFAAFPSTTAFLPPSDNYMYLTLIMKMDLYVGSFC